MTQRQNGRRPIGKDSQPSRLLKMLRDGPVTALAAWGELGIYRAADPVHVLRKRGYLIDTTLVQFRTSRGYDVEFAKYTLLAEPKMHITHMDAAGNKSSELELQA